MAIVNWEGGHILYAMQPQSAEIYSRIALPDTGRNCFHSPYPVIK